jgi:hypothetical protein
MTLTFARYTQQLKGYEEGLYVWTNGRGVKHLVADPSIEKDLIEERLGQQNAQQVLGMIETLQERSLAAVS